MNTQYCTFTVDQLFFGIPVAKVQEVIRGQSMTRVPLAPREVRGLINLRGQIITAIDLRRRLGLADRPDDRPPMNVLLKTDDCAVSLLVDQIEDILEVEDNSLEDPPQTLQGFTRQLILGASKQKDRLLLILDTEQAASLPGSTMAVEHASSPL